MNRHLAILSTLLAIPIAIIIGYLVMVFTTPEFRRSIGLTEDLVALGAFISGIIIYLSLFWIWASRRVDDDSAPETENSP